MSVYLVFSIFMAAGQFSFSESYPGINISNFGQINKNYYRGGQPNAADCAALKNMGVKTVIDLQKDGKDEEASWVRNAGMKFFKIPMSSTRPATPEQAEYFLKIVNNPNNWPVFVHCAGGRHRTGGMTAIYRIANDSWTADQAFKEMKKYHYYAFPNHGSWKKYVYGYYQDFQLKSRNAAAKPIGDPSAVPVAAPFKPMKPVTTPQ
jgi:protein tyrosine/serine phosphatase